MEPPAGVTSYFARLCIITQSDPEAREAFAGTGQDLSWLQQDGGQSRDFVRFVIAGRFNDRSLRPRLDFRGVLDGVNSMISPPPGNDVDFRKELMKSSFRGPAMGLEQSATRVPESSGLSEHMREPSVFNNELIANLEAKNRYMQLVKDAHNQFKKAKQNAEGDEDDWMLRITKEHLDSVRREYEFALDKCG